MTQADSPSEPVRCAIYVRVSSEEQARDGYSLDTQERLCRQKLDEVYGPDLYEAVVYADDGYTGKLGLYDPDDPKGKFRPLLTKMQEAFKSGQHEVLCCYRLDRIWRRAALADFISQHFLPHGLERVICVREHVDLSTASGRFHVNMMAAAGAFEAELLGERVSDSLQQRRDEGYTLGPPPYGWRWQRDEEMGPGQDRTGIAPIEEEGEMVRWMADRYLAGDGILTITQKLNDRGVPTKRGGKRWHRSSVKRILANPKQAGLQEVEEGRYERAHHYEHRHYDPEMFHKIRARMDRDAKHHVGSAHVPEYLFGGLIRCGHCGSPLNCRRVNRTNRRYYRCSTGCSRGTDTMCSRNTKPADVVEAVVLSEIEKIAQTEEIEHDAATMLEEMVDSSDVRLREDVKRLEQQLEETWGKYELWSDRHYDGELTKEEFEFHRERFLEQKEDLEHKLAEYRDQLQSREQRAAELRQAQEMLREFDAAFEGLIHEQRREMMHLLVDDVEMFHQDDGSTRVIFTICFHGHFEQIIPKLHGGDLTLTIRQMEAYKLWGQGLDRHAIASKLGVTAPCVTSLLWQGRKRAGAETYEECYEIARDEIEENEAILFTGRCRRKRTKNPNKPPLTDTQRQVLSLCSEDLTGPEIAERLKISPSTVYVHLMNCRDRLGRATNEEAVKHAREMGYIE